MGAEACFCCFRNCNPGCASFVGFAANIIAFAFMIWCIADVFFIKNGSEVLYIITFVILCICLICFLILFFISIIKSAQSSRAANNFGRILCLLIIVLSVIALIFLIIGFIIEIAKHAQIEKDFPVKFWPTSEWAALIIPFLLGVIALIIMAKAANALYAKFFERMNSAPISVNITQNTFNTMPNAQQPGIFPNNNGVFQNIQGSGQVIKN